MSLLLNLRRTLIAMITGAALTLTCQAQPAPRAAATTGSTVLRATLPNGLRVVIVRNTLAPVVATSVNYMVGSQETPAGFPGTAHAQEHMMFRGSPGLSADQLANIGSVMGGNFNANTREGVTQYLYTVPSEDLDVALHIEALRMSAVMSTQMRTWICRFRSRIPRVIGSGPPNSGCLCQLSFAMSSPRLVKSS